MKRSREAWLAIFTAVLGCKRDAPQTTDAASAQLDIASASAPSADVASPPPADASADVVDASRDAAEGGKHTLAAEDASAMLELLSAFGGVNGAPFDGSFGELLTPPTGPFINPSCGASTTKYPYQPEPNVLQGEVSLTVLGGARGTDAGELARVRGRMRACVDAALRSDPTTEGSLMLEVVVAPDGTVSSVKTTNTTVQSPLESCLSNRMRSAKFDPETSQRKFVVTIRASKKGN